MERTGLTLDPNQVMALGQLRLEIGQLTDQVTVESQMPLVETSTADRGFVISSKQVVELALNGRDFQSLMRTLPGVVSNDSSDFRLAFNNTDAFNTNGLRGSMNNVFLDGSINTDVGANDGQYTQISLDAVGEFKVETSNFAAEYGRNPGVLISISTKSGTSRFHGTAYEFLRNDDLDARSYFTNLQGAPTPKLRFNQFGGNVGGWVYIPKVSTPQNKKLFFFVNYEGTRASRPNGGTFVDTFSPDLLNGDFQKSFRFNADGSPVLIKNSTFPVGTVFMPGTVVRDSANNILGGTPFPNNTVPQSLWAKNTPGFLKVINAINRQRGVPVPGSPDVVRIPFQDTYSFNKNAEVVRADYNINAKNNAFFRWADDSQHEQQGYGIFSGNSYPIFPEFRAKPGASWSYNLISVISPTMTNEAIFTYNHLTQVVQVTPGTDPATYDRTKLGFTFQELYPGSNVDNRFPNFSASGFNSSIFPPGWLSEGKTYAWTDNLTKVFGSHTFKTGVYFNYNDNGQQPSWTDASNLNFNSSVDNPADTGSGLANLLLGNYTTLSQSNGRFFGSFRFFQTEFFAQDSWKVNRKLTIEYGARYAYLGPTYTRGKYLQNYFEPNLYVASQAVSLVTNQPGKAVQGSIVPGSGNPFNGLIQEGAKGLPLGGIQHHYNNISPRFGFAYDPFGTGKTSIRGGFGTFFERIRQNSDHFDGLGNPPLVYTPTLLGGNVDNISPALISSGIRYPVSLNAFAEDGKIPTIYSWSLGVQRELGAQTSIDVSYVGNTVRHLEYKRDINSLPLGTTLQPGLLASVGSVNNALRPYQGFTGINFTDFGADSNYNALQVRASRRFAKHLTANASYAWSKALDQTDSDTNSIQYAFNRTRDWAPAGFDRTHVFTFDYVYELPTYNRNGFTKSVLGGWQVSGITRFWTGPPSTIGSPGNPGTLGNGPRADYIGGDPLANSTVKSQFSNPRIEFLNPYAFARAADGTLGNTARNIIRGPGINQWDISVFKNTRLTENVNLQLRLETFNTFNHVQFTGFKTGVPNEVQPGQVVTPATVGTFGQFTGTRDPRNVQLGAKLYF